MKDYDFLDKDSIVLLDQMYTIQKSELWEEWYMGNLNDTTELDKAICYNFDVFESILATLSDFLKQYETEYKKEFSRK